MPDTPARPELLGELGERIIEVFRHLQAEVTVPREGLVHVTRSESDIMRIVMEIPGTTVTEIARAFGQHKSNTSTRVAALVDKGLLRKESAAADGREVRVFATPAAIENLEKYRDVWAEELDPVTPEDAERLAATVETLAAIADALAARTRVGEPPRG
ncbi:MarR family winged helix-turn-helix transcriptional regulator [Agromyces rhizosphaerae]|nr:MarR family transcriptional regulator [Agromyces rhizosphaerae]